MNCIRTLFLGLLVCWPIVNSATAQTPTIHLLGNGWTLDVSRGNAFTEWQPQLSRGVFNLRDVPFVHPHAPQESFTANDLQSLNASLGQRFRALFRCEESGNLNKERFELTCRGERAEQLRQTLDPAMANLQGALMPVFNQNARQHFGIDRVACPLGQDYCRVIYLRDRLEGAAAPRSPARAKWESPPFTPDSAMSSERGR